MIANNTKELTRGDTGLYSITLYDAEGGEYIPTAPLLRIRHHSWVTKCIYTSRTRVQVGA